MELFTPAWKSKYRDEALNAVAKITGQRKLARVAKKACNEYARRAAVEKLTDPALLADVAKNAEDSDARTAAVKKLTDQTLLADIAGNDKAACVRYAAVEKLTDPTLLVNIAKNDKESYVRRAAIINLISQNNFFEALKIIYCINTIKEKIFLAHALVHLAEKSGQPLKAQWTEIKNWIESLPDKPHDDGGSFHCNTHTDEAKESAPAFPPYPIES
jgi:hypothetical protein